MIDIPYNEKIIARNEKRFGMNDGSACIICSAKINDLDNHKLWLRIVDGGTSVGTEAEAEKNPAADLGYYPIGKDCLAKNPELKWYISEKCNSSSLTRWHTQGESNAAGETSTDSHHLTS